MTRAAAVLLTLWAGTAAADPVMRLAVAGNGFDLEPGDILQAEAEQSEFGAVLFFRLAAGPSAALRQLTEASIGQPMDLIVCGEVLVSPIVMEVIGAGVGQINLDSLENAQTLASVLHGDSSCTEFRGG